MGKLLAILSCVALLITVSNSYSFAHEDLVGTDSAGIAGVEEKSAYVLVYPGMLPDNPLYFLKALRDGFIGLVISDPLKKAEFLLLQADKNISSGELIISQGKSQELAEETSRKAHKFYEEALMKAETVEGKDQERRAFLEKLISAGKKHEEVLEELFQETENKEFTELSQRSGELAESAHAVLDEK